MENFNKENLVRPKTAVRGHHSPWGLGSNQDPDFPLSGPPATQLVLHRQV